MRSNRQIFGADAVLYLKITEYGITYKVLLSDTRGSVEARRLDLRTGQMLWEGSATASSSEQQGDTGGGVVGMLVQAVIYQVADTLTEKSHQIAGIASQRLLSAGRPNGLLYGPPLAPLQQRVNHAGYNAYQVIVDTRVHSLRRISRREMTPLTMPLVSITG